MPAEWAKHARTLISWPVQESMVYPDDYETVSQGYAEIIKAITEFEPVMIVVNAADKTQVKPFYRYVMTLRMRITLLPRKFCSF